MIMLEAIKQDIARVRRNRERLQARKNACRHSQRHAMDRDQWDRADRLSIEAESCHRAIRLCGIKLRELREGIRHEVRR
jgi:hypothetical protein